jgi:hypothetical protein
MAFTYLRPDADDTDGGWTNDADGTTLFSAIDEIVADDNDFIKSSDNGVVDLAKIRLSNPAGGVAQPATVRYRYKKIGSTGIILTVTLYQGAAEIASWTHSGISGSFATVDQLLTSPQFVSITDFDALFLGFEAAPIDAATLAWIAAVVGNGGTVSGARQALVNNLIVGLKADGIFTKLDRLWLFAGEDQPSALTDIIANSLATAVNSPTFTVDRGYAGDASTSYIDTGYNPTGGPNYVQDSAQFSVWDNTSRGVNSQVPIGVRKIGGGNLFAEMEPFTADVGGNKSFGRINSDGFNDLAATVADAIGFWQVNRSGASAAQLYLNGSSIATDNLNSSSGIPNFNFFVCGDNNAGTLLSPTSDQISAAAMGGSLNGTESGNFYSRLRTYMTAVGVP